MFVLFAAAMVGLFGAEIATDYSPVKLTALFCTLFWFPLLVVHELGHAVVARAFGCHVTRVSLGYGRTLWRLDIGSATVDVRAIPIEGFVQFERGSRRIGRLRNALIYFAGPGTELLLAGLLVLAVGPDRVLARTDAVPLLAVQALCTCVAVSVIMNLIPHTANASLEAVTDGRRPTPNDGLGIVRSLFGRVD